MNNLIETTDQNIKSLIRYVKFSQISNTPKIILRKIRDRFKTIIPNLKLRYIINLNKRLKNNIDLVVICNSYPCATKNKYGGGFIESRVLKYSERLKSILVIEINNQNRFHPVLHIDNKKGIYILRLSQYNFEHITLVKKIWMPPLFIHSPSPWIINKLVDKTPHKKNIFLFYHGYETRDYRRLRFNYSTESLANSYEGLERVNKQRVSANRKVFGNEKITKIFVSRYLNEICTQDIGIATNAKIIPNFIDTEYFKSNIKCADDRFKVLLIRSFDRMNYAGDLACQALIELSKHHTEIFNSLKVTICGTGMLFDKTVNKLKKFNNINIIKQHLSKEEMKQKFTENGIFLSPSRHDTQGVTMCEAMAAGMPVVTNNICGIPEFATTQSAILCKANNPKDFANGILRLINEPELYIKLANNASPHITRICGEENTIDTELDLLKT